MKDKMLRSILAFCLLPFAVCLLPSPVAAQTDKDLSSKVDEIFSQVSSIMGLKIHRPVPRAFISREKIREYIEQRMNETLSPEEIRAQEIVLKKFGFVGEDFDWKAQTLDLLAEQAAAFYDFKQKKLYLASWASSAMQDVALVHELAHALADQHFHLEKFIKRAGDDDDAATARGAVVEGQASWVMTEYTLRQLGRSLKDSPQLAEATGQQTNDAAKEYPVFGKAPLYLRETLLFPYTEGLFFQQAVFQKLGRDAFAEVFRRAPASSQQVMHPDLYWARARPTKPALPSARLPSGYKKLMEGTMGELDHQILLRQFIGEPEARELAPRWKGSRYAVWENKKDRRAVLYYTVEWAADADAARYFRDYRKAAGQKWKRLETSGDDPQIEGTGDDGRFSWSVRGAVFTAIEGLP